MSEWALSVTLAVFYLFVAIVALVFSIGWVINAYRFVMLVLNHAPIDVLWIGRLVGLPIPFVGALLGYIG